MNVRDPKLHADERRVTSPLFTDRRPGECAWPLWPDHPVVPLHTKRCCGAPVLSGSKVPYCTEHLTLQSGLGTKSEQTAPRRLLAMTASSGER